MGARTPEPEEPSSIWARPVVHGTARWIGLILFLAVGWLYLFSGLMVPVWAVGLLWVLYIVFLAVLIKIWRSNPWLVLAMPFVTYLVWVGVLLAGDIFLGWTA